MGRTQNSRLEQTYQDNDGSWFTVRARRRSCFCASLSQLLGLLWAAVAGVSMRRCSAPSLLPLLHRGKSGLPANGARPVGGRVARLLHHHRRTETCRCNTSIKLGPAVWLELVADAGAGASLVWVGLPHVASERKQTNWQKHCGTTRHLDH